MSTALIAALIALPAFAAGVTVGEILHVDEPVVWAVACAIYFAAFALARHILNERRRNPDPPQ